jgi:hypothetical protein
MRRIKALLDRDLLVTFGPHYTGLKGYFCSIHKHPNQGGEFPDIWKNCGHGLTMRGALTNALNVLDGGKAKSSNKFKRII